MPRPGQTRIAKPIGLTLQPDMYDAFNREAGEGYGAKATLFRRMWSAYLDQRDGSDDSLRRQLIQEKQKNLRLERRLELIRKALANEGLM